MEKTFKRLLSMAVVLVMVLGMVPASPIQVSAAGEAPTNSTPVDPTVAANAEAETRYQEVLAKAAQLVAADYPDGECPFCGMEVTWTELSGPVEDHLGTRAHVYLTGDVTYNGTDTFVGGTSTSCLVTNGHNITATAATVIGGNTNAANVIAVSGDKQSTITGAQSAINSTNAPTINLYGGTYTATGSSQNVIYLNNGNLNIYNATVTAVSTGRAIRTQAATVNIYGSATSTTINGGTAAASDNANNGGTIYSHNAAVNICGGTIQGGNVTNLGGNIYGTNRTKLTIGADAIVTGGTATSKGGNIYHNNNGITANDQPDSLGKVVIYGTVTKGKATNYDGGNICIENTAPLTVNDGEISGGTAGRWGGNIVVGAGGMTVNGGLISGGSAPNGGSIYINGGAANIAGGTIQNGVATSDGGNILVKGSNTLTIGADATIKGGSANRGGNICSVEGSTAITTSGKITGGNATGSHGGNIFTAVGTLTVDGGEISGGTSGYWGGNMRATNITINGGLIYGGTAAQDATCGNIRCNSGYLHINGGVIVGDVNDGGFTSIKLSGSPKIVERYTWTENGEQKTATAKATALKLDSLNLDIDGLQPDARISVQAGTRQVTKAYAGSGDVTKLIDCFKVYVHTSVVKSRCFVYNAEDKAFYIEAGHDKEAVAEHYVCWEEGNIAHTRCTNCGAVYDADYTIRLAAGSEKLPKRPHNYKFTYHWAEDNTCTVDYVCQYSDCQDQNKNGPVACAVTSTTVESTCTTPGKTVYTASITRSDVTYTDTKTVDLPLADHVKDETTYVSPTETNVPGKWETKCATCGQVIGEWTIEDYVSISEVALSISNKDDLVDQPLDDPSRGTNINVQLEGNSDYKSNEIVLKLYDEDGALMSTTVNVPVSEGGSADSYGKVKANIELSRDSGSWNTTWEEGYPNADAKPYKIVLYCNGGGVSMDQVRYIRVIGEDELTEWAGYEGVNPERSHVSDEAVRENVVEAQCEVAGSYDEVVYCVNCFYEISRVNKPIDALEHVFGDEKDKYCHNGCGKQNPDYAVVAFINGEPYATLELALKEAKDGDVVVLDVDCTAEEVYVRRGRKLDLNGCTLTVTGEVTAANATAQIVDSSNGEGVMVIARDSVAFNAANTYLPVWVEEDNGFHFVSHTFTTAVRDHNDLGDLNEDQLVFRARLSGEADCFLAQQLADGGNDNGVSLKIKMTWTSATGNTFEQYFTVTEEKVMQYAANISEAQNWTKAYFQLKVTGVQNASDISFAAMVTYGTTVQITSDVSTVN